MRAITVSSYGASPSVTELPTPQAGPGQVLITTRAAGMNPMDMQIANGGWQDRVPAQFPMVLGADLAGFYTGAGGRSGPGGPRAPWWHRADDPPRRRIRRRSHGLCRDRQ